METKLIHSNIGDYLKSVKDKFDMTFMDPPFNQGKDYIGHDDNMLDFEYWGWIGLICSTIYEQTNDGGCIYFMQREKNTKDVILALTNAGWKFQNMIIWKKKTSAVPQANRYGKQFQVIVFATKGDRPRVFNKLRIDPPLLVTEKIKRENGMFVTDVWDDIRELTSGYFAGDEPLKTDDGQRFHKQQAPIKLLTRMILSSTNPGDTVFDPFCGTATTNIVSKQLNRDSIGIDINSINIEMGQKRLDNIRGCDDILKFRNDYSCTSNLDDIWKI